MKIPMSIPTITRKELEGVLDCLMRNQLIEGESIKNFESSLAETLGRKYSIATNSLTSAYHLIFSALEISDGAEVIMPSFIPESALSALNLCRGKAVLVDNEENSIFPSTEDIKNKITDNTKAILINHLFGFRFDTSLLSETTVPVIEDISFSLGSPDNISDDKKSAFTVISFAPSMIITTGQGGMILTDNSRHYSKMKDLRWNNSETLNYNYMMTDFQGAMGISQLGRLKAFVKRRQEIARIYYDALKITPHKSPLPFSESFTYQSFPLLFDAPVEKVNKFWQKNGIEIGNPLKKPLHAYLNIRNLDFPNSERFSKKLYSIPIYPTLTKKEIEKITMTLKSFI